MKKLIAAAVSAALFAWRLLRLRKMWFRFHISLGAVSLKFGESLPVSISVSDAHAADRTRISNKVNGYGMEMAAIRANRNVDEIVREAFEELRAAASMSPPGGAAASLAIVRFYSHFETGLFSGEAVADIHMRVSVKAADGSSLFDRDVNVTGKQTGVQIASGKQCRRLALGRHRAGF